MPSCRLLYAEDKLVGVIKLDDYWYSQLMLASIMLATERYVHFYLKSNFNWTNVLTCILVGRSYRTKRRRMSHECERWLHTFINSGLPKHLTNQFESERECHQCHLCRDSSAKWSLWEIVKAHRRINQCYVIRRFIERCRIGQRTIQRKQWLIFAQICALLLTFILFLVK